MVDLLMELVKAHQIMEIVPPHVLLQFTCPNRVTMALVKLVLHVTVTVTVNIKREN
jgi:hypothetical protein